MKGLVEYFQGNMGCHVFTLATRPAAWLEHGETETTNMIEYHYETYIHVFGVMGCRKKSGLAPVESLMCLYKTILPHLFIFSQSRCINSKFLLLTDSLFSLHSLMDLYSTNPLVQRIHLTIYTLNSIIAPKSRLLGSLVTSVSLNTMR